MQNEYRLAIRVGIIALFFILRHIYKNMNSGPKGISISSMLDADRNLIERLQLQPGEPVELVSRPNTFLVTVRAKGITDSYEDIGAIHDRELSEKVKNNSALGMIEYTAENKVKLIFTY